MARRVLASVLAFEDAAATMRTLVCLREQTLRPDRVLVIDNGSRAPVADHLAARSFRLEEHESLVRLDVNRGVGAGHNVGLRRTMDDGDDLVWLLEHDSFVLPECLATLVGTLDESGDDGLVAVHPRLSRNRYELSLESAGRDLDTGEQRPRTLLKGPGHTLTFNGLLLPTSLVRRLGPIREDLFVGLEDNDYHRRLTALGGRLVETDAWLAIHPNRGLRRYPEPPSVLRRYYTVRNHLWLRREAEGRVPLSGVARSTLALGRDVLRGQGALAGARARGIVDGVGRPPAPPVTEW
jgi:GT2 family glycosyltransferase